MKSWTPGATLILVITAATLGAATTAAAQDEAAALPPPPAEVQRLIDLAKDPDQLREALSDPAKIQQLMDTMESDAVREYFSDPQRVQQLMQEINPLAIAQAMRAVDFAKVRLVALARWKARLKQQLGVTDEEWKALEPKIDGLVRARQEVGPAGSGGGGGRFGFGLGGGAGPPPGGPGQEPSAVQEAAAEMRAVLADPDATGFDVRRHIKAYQQARDKARQKLETAEQELRELLTLRQEAILVVSGVLR